jgi:hypothetical protein
MNERYQRYKDKYKIYRDKHKLEKSELSKKVRLLNKDKFINLNRANRDRIYFGGIRDKVLERDNWTCQKCGMNNEQHIVLFGRSITIDHKDGNGRYSKIPNNNLDNLITLCLKCHGKKDILNHPRYKDSQYSNAKRDNKGRFLKGSKL